MEQRYVGIDFHRRRSVIVHKDAAGTVLETVHLDNDREAFARELAKAGEHPEVVLEACYGWYWLADFLEELGANLHLAHPLGNNWGHRRVKNDERDAEDLVDLLRLGRLAEAYIAPPELRELREIVRYRAKLVGLRSALKSQVHSVLAKEGVAVPMTDLFGTAGQDLLNIARLGRAYGIRVESLRDLISAYDKEIAMLEGEVDRWLAGDKGYLAIQAIPGVGPVLGAVFCAEIGDVSRFSSPDKLPAGPGSRRGTASPTSTSCAARSRNKAAVSCAGQRSRPHSGEPGSKPSASNGSPSVATRTRSPGWLSPGTSSPSSTSA